MPKIQMTVIPEPEEGTAAVLAPVPNFAEANSYTVMSGSADTDYICGACRTPIAIGVSQGQLVGLVLKCGKCQSYNAIRGTKL